LIARSGFFARAAVVANRGADCAGDELRVDPDGFAAPFDHVCYHPIAQRGGA
jgi:hypothetical protein